MALGVDRKGRTLEAASLFEFPLFAVSFEPGDENILLNGFLLARCEALSAPTFIPVGLSVLCRAGAWGKRNSG